VYDLASNGAQPVGPIGAAGVFSAVLVFVALNHLMVGLAVGLAASERLSESGIFGWLTVSIDVALAAAGAAAAVIWFANPYVSLIALVPVYLISTTLKVPALERQAMADPKTGVFNARHFQERLEDEMSRANRFDRPLTVVMGDLDLLRNINNVYGHLAGDQVLITVAEILKGSVREYDVVARFGGEEFTILLPETSLEQALPRIEALRAAIAEADIEVLTSVEPIRTTMSFGLAQREGAGDSPEGIVHRADLAVYKAKFEGRNCVQVARQGDGEDSGCETNRKAPVASTTEAETLVVLSAAVVGLPNEGQTYPSHEDGVPGDETDISVPSFEESGAKEPHPHRTSVSLRRLLIAGVALASLGILTATMTTGPGLSISWLGLIVVAAVAATTEALAIEVYVRDTSVSTSAAALTAGAILFGPLGALVIGTVIAAAAMIKHHSPCSRFVFNCSVQVMAGLGCVWIVRLVGQPPKSEAPWLLLGVSVLAALAVYAVTTILVAAALSLDSHESLRRTWMRHFSWLAPYYLGLGALASCLVLGFANAGVIGIVGLIVPLLLLRFGQKQYIDHTAAMVGQLRTANTELKNRTEDVSTLNDELLLLLSGTLDLRDPYVLGHSRHVARYAWAIGEELGLTAYRLDLLRKAALLHDIGKLALPDVILAKDGPLTDLEFDQVKAHPGAGAHIFVESRFLQGILPIIRHHHERYDGDGYPSGLKGEAIPLEARILSVADAVEAMASDRSYRLGAPNEIVLHELRENVGTQFDPAVVDAFCRAVAKRTCSIVNSSDAVRELRGERKSLVDARLGDSPSAVPAVS
jgi:diguanylate cyclase (GGDEF)-like protein/putative nucleotidyltransferase with HDIG domain